MASTGVCVIAPVDLSIISAAIVNPFPRSAPPSMDGRQAIFARLPSQAAGTRSMMVKRHLSMGAARIPISDIIYVPCHPMWTTSHKRFELLSVAEDRRSGNGIRHGGVSMLTTDHASFCDITIGRAHDGRQFLIPTIIAKTSER
jgi:hypothetical protein